MKAINKVFQILTIVFGLAALVLFFTKFATITANGSTVSGVGAQFAFGSKLKLDGAEYAMAKSSDILFCLILTAASFLGSIFSFKNKTLRYAVPGVGLVAGIYMLVIALSVPRSFIDPRPLPDVTGVTYGISVLLAAIALLALAVFGTAYLLIDDYLEVQEAKGDRLTIPKRIVRFFRDYKSEVKKIVWPGPRDVVKNTVIVLIICLIIGAFVWLLDFGLGQLLKLAVGS